LSITSREKLISIIPEIKNYREGEAIVSKWLDLETDPEVLASEELELFEEIEKNLDSNSLLNVEMSESTPIDDLTLSPTRSLSLLVSDDVNFNVSEETTKNMLLKYSLSAIKNVKDPVLLAMAEGMRSFLGQK
jgi:hypothetical protein